MSNLPSSDANQGGKGLLQELAGPELPADPSGQPRLKELDSIRGAASFSVVLLHFYSMWMPNDVMQLPLWAQGLLFCLKPLYSGSEAVILFFVLSGLVLALPYFRGSAKPYQRYLMRRILRIYGPYLTALALALAGAAIWHGHPYHGEWASDTWTRPLALGLVAQHIAFLGAYDWRQYNFVIWTLIQEMRVSIILPFLFFAVKLLGSARSVLCGLALSGLAMIFAPAHLSFSVRYSFIMTIHYSAFFVVGVVLATRLREIEQWWHRSAYRIRCILAVVSVIAYAYAGPIVRRISRMVEQGAGGLTPTTSAMILTDWITLCGAVGLLVIGLHAAQVRAALQSKPARFLGRTSYSLYLVHPIVLFALTFSCGDKVSLWLQLPLYLTGAVFFSWLFCVAVEEPFIRWSRSV